MNLLFLYAYDQVDNEAKKLQWRKISSEIKRSKDNSKFQSNSSKPERLKLQETQGETGQK